ncbi:MAG: hypothetical protein U9R01_00770 [candidate division WOR-3 bacterium]|nr:hypothetical protein [candidate division WOR-3 bacterium]
MLKKFTIMVFVTLIASSTSAGPPGQKYTRKYSPTNNKGHEDRRFGITTGNLIRTRISNFGSIGGPGDRNKPRLEWPIYSGHEYGYEMGPMIGAEVIGKTEDGERDTTIYIVIDGIQDGGGEEFEPLGGYANPSPPLEWQGWFAFSDKPETWPPVWPDGTTEWPGEFGSGIVTADQESYCVMTDEACTGYQDEYGPTYYPDPNDSTLHGLGIQLAFRHYQWAASLAEDIVFFIYEIKNISPTRLDKVVVGVFGDFDIGGYPDYGDDCFAFDATRNMVYTWDSDNSSVNFESDEDIGWLGFKMLETPKDLAGEELGLTAVTSFVYGLAYALQDSVMWNYMIPGTFNIPTQSMDHVTLFSSGYFSLEPGESQRFSVAVVIGADSADMFENSEVAQEIYDLGYEFTKAPDKPSLIAVPGDGKVTLYWDTKSEASLDPVLGNDFEGYKIYKGTTRNTKTWGKAITDALGRQVANVPEVQFDKIDGIKGLFPIGSNGYHFHLGDETGLLHSWIDSNVVNGMKYYYAITAYDTGCVDKGILPSESPMTLGGPNVIEVIPNAPSAGYESPEVNLQHTRIFGTGEFIPIIIDPQKVKDGHQYKITFDDTSNSDTTYSVFDITDGTTLIVDCPYIHGEDAGDVFDGIRLKIISDEIAYDSSNWLQGDCRYTVGVKPYTGGVKYPADYEISFFDGVVDTDIVGHLVNFKVWNVTDSVSSPFFFANTGVPDSVVRDKDAIVPIIYQNGNLKGTWEIRFNQPDTLSVPPGDGDKLLMTIKKPFTSCDVILLTTKAAEANPEVAKSQIERIAVVPNPYIVAAAWEPEILEPTMAQQAVGTEHDRRIDFIHLPSRCTIRIYTMSGELVKVIEHNSTVFDGTESWNMLSKDNMEISYGIYIYHIDAPEIGTKIGKFAIIK